MRRRKAILLTVLAMIVAGAAYASGHGDHPCADCSCETEGVRHDCSCETEGVCASDECSCGTEDECDHCSCGTDSHHVHTAPLDEEPASGGCHGCPGRCGD